MSTTGAYEAVISAIEGYLRDQGRTPPPMSPATEIMRDLEIDSLGLAEIVIALEERTGRDPFVDGFREFRTVAELAELYA